MELFEDIQTGCGADLGQPLHWKPMPLHKLCQQALFWKGAGFAKRAAELAHWLLPLEPFLPLWCPEKEYDEAKGREFFSLLSEIEPVAGERPELSLFHSPSLSAVFTLEGAGTSLGVIRMGNVEIRAFGPQTNSLQFGIQGKGMDGWARCAALPEVWLEMKPECQETQCKIDLRFVGLQPETPLFFAFYVKAESCQVGKEIFKPKSLRRFVGEAQTVVFENGRKIESAIPHKVQVIPLAGEGCFWDCQFLICFEIHPIEPRASFFIHSIFTSPCSCRDGA